MAVAPQTTTTNKKEEVLELSLLEMRRTFDHISHIYDQVRVKALGFIAGEIALVTFLFASPIPFPQAPYGQILMLGAAAALVVAFGLLMWTISAVPWRIPCDFEGHAVMTKKYPSKLKALEYVHDEYVTTINSTSQLVGKRAKRFNWTIYLISAGAILLLLLKYGG